MSLQCKPLTRSNDSPHLRGSSFCCSKSSLVKAKAQRSPEKDTTIVNSPCCFRETWMPAMADNIRTHSSRFGPYQRQLCVHQTLSRSGKRTRSPKRVEGGQGQDIQQCTALTLRQWLVKNIAAEARWKGASGHLHLPWKIGMFQEKKKRESYG